jgi:hypothetical protein
MPQTRPRARRQTRSGSMSSFTTRFEEFMGTPRAVYRGRIARTTYEGKLLERFPRDKLRAETQYSSDDYDHRTGRMKPPKRLTLYYYKVKDVPQPILDRVQRLGDRAFEGMSQADLKAYIDSERHVGTWQSGSGWHEVPRRRK